MSVKKRVLIFVDWFEPGFRAGGPIRSCVNIALQLKDDREIYVFTSDTDLGATTPYNDIISDKWIKWNNSINVYYSSEKGRNWRSIKQQIKGIKPDFIYLNSMFSPFFTVFPLLILKAIHFKGHVILAPRGMLRISALRFKKVRKSVFLTIFRLLRLHSNVTFHATDAIEYDDVRRQFGSDVRLLQVNDFPGLLQDFIPFTGKQKSEVKMIFVGRIHPVKNLKFLYSVLRQVSYKVELTVVASIEDREYWQECEKARLQLPKNITIDFKGEMPNGRLPELIRQHHLFVLPTTGENFGHAIFEALSVGRPVLISDQTPWQNLSESKAGWDLPLNGPVEFQRTIELISEMDQLALNEWCNGAWNFCRNYLEKSGIKAQYLKLFS